MKKKSSAKMPTDGFPRNKQDGGVGADCAGASFVWGCRRTWRRPQKSFLSRSAPGAGA
nr:hypothetical protein [Hoylesella enoeca]